MAKGAIRKFLAVTAVIGLIMVGCSESEQEKAHKKSVKEAAEKTRKELIAAEAAEKSQKGFHCLSSWDGTHSGVEKYIKNNLRDPDSYQHIGTRITPVKDGIHTLISTYRAKNGFGGYVNGNLIAEISNATCRATVIAHQ